MSTDLQIYKARRVDIFGEPRVTTWIKIHRFLYLRQDMSNFMRFLEVRHYDLVLRSGSLGEGRGERQKCRPSLTVFSSRGLGNRHLSKSTRLANNFQNPKSILSTTCPSRISQQRVTSRPQVIADFVFRSRILHSWTLWPRVAGVAMHSSPNKHPLAHAQPVYTVDRTRMIENPDRICGLGWRTCKSALTVSFDRR